MQRYTVLYLSNGRISGFGTQAVNATHAVVNFGKTYPGTDVAFVDLGDMEQVVQAYMLEQQKVDAPITVWKVYYELPYRSMTLYVGADTEEDAVRVTETHLMEENALGLSVFARRQVTQAPFWGREYGVLDVTEVQN